MPLGIVSDEDFDSDLGNCNIILPEEKSEESKEEEFPIIPVEEILGSVALQKSLGRGNAKGVPTVIRKLIGEEYALSGREDGNLLAESLGLSSSSASAYGNGATSTASYNKPSKPIEDFIKGRKERIIKKASAKMIVAIDAIDEDKIAEAPAGVLAGIARSLSGVIRDLEPPVRDEKTTNVQFVMYAPKLVAESSLDVINLNE